MFTGIVTDTGEIVKLEDRGGMRRVLIGTHYDVEKMTIGASVACDGCCLTVADREAGCLVFEISNETLSATALGDWKEGSKVNLEKSLRAGDELGGHIVTGHVDGVAVLADVTRDGGSRRLVFDVPDRLARMIAPKGSLSLAGVSLTVNDVQDARFGVNIIPHTWEVTNINRWKPGERVNVEIDILARYVARILGQEG